VLAAVGQPEQLQQLGAVVGAGRPPAAQPRRQPQVLGHGQVGDQVVGRPLEHVAEQPPADPA